MQPYVIKQGDYMAKLAHEFGFEADTVWNDDKNADLRTLRPDPNMLWPSDVLYIPDQVDKDAKTIPLETGTTNDFVAHAPTVTVTLKFLDAECASKPCKVEELPDLKDLSTDSEGLLKFDVPVTLDVATVQFEDPPFTCGCQIGGLHPAATLSGVFQRLRNLAYFVDDETIDTSGDVETVRGGVRAFKAPASTPFVGGSSSSGAGQDDAYTPAQQGVSSNDDGTSPGSTNETDESAPSPGGGDGGAGSHTAEPSATDNAGLRDDGTLEDETSHLLLTAHGC